MLELDGGHGGGQLLRSALALSALSGRAFDLQNVRGDRSDPGLRPQHLAAVRLAAEVCDARVEGAETGSDRVQFDPGQPTSGRYAVDIETAGSATLVCETLLPVVARLEGPLRVQVTGGTDVKWSPPADYLRRVKLPVLRKYGVPAAVEIDRRGFYPVGGGQVTLTLAPGEFERLDLTARDYRNRATVHAVASDDLADADVAERLARTTETGLRNDGWTVASRSATIASTDSPGAVLVVRLGFEGSVAGITAFGERGVAAERVASRALHDARAFERTAAAVDPYLADQLLVPLALAGGQIRVPRVTNHVATSLGLLRRFGVDVTVEDRTVRVPDAGTLNTPG